MSPKRFFLFRPGALGDSLVLAPALGAIRRRFPGARVTVACQPGAARLMRESGLADDAFSQDDTRLLPLFSAGPAGMPAGGVPGPFDVAVAWLRDPAGTVAEALRAWGAETVIVAPSLPEPASGGHVVEHIFATLAGIGLTAGDAPPVPLLRAPAEDVAWARDYVPGLTAGRRELIVVHPGSGGRRKNWPPEAFAAVAGLLSEEFGVLFVGGPADEEALAGVSATYAGVPTVARDLPLGRLAALLQCCAAYLGNDSGVSHLAALLGVPTVALFGPTDPRLWRPYGPRVTTLRWAEPRDLPVETVAAAVRSAADRWRKALARG